MIFFIHFIYNITLTVIFLPNGFLRVVRWFRVGWLLVERCHIRCCHCQLMRHKEHPFGTTAAYNPLIKDGPYKQYLQTGYVSGVSIRLLGIVPVGAAIR